MSSRADFSIAYQSFAKITHTLVVCSKSKFFISTQHSFAMQKLFMTSAAPGFRHDIRFPSRTAKYNVILSTVSWVVLGLFFLYKCSFEEKNADGWIQTWVLWFWKYPLCQLCLSHCPQIDSPRVIKV